MKTRRGIKRRCFGLVCGVLLQLTGMCDPKTNPLFCQWLVPPIGVPGTCY